MGCVQSTAGCQQRAIVPSPAHRRGASTPECEHPPAPSPAPSSVPAEERLQPNDRSPDGFAEMSAVPSASPPTPETSGDSIDLSISSAASDSTSNPLIFLSHPTEESEEERQETTENPRTQGSPHEQAVSLNSLSVFSPKAICDRAESARRYCGGFHDSWGMYYPTPEERYATLRTELATVHGGADPLSVITGRGTLWVHQYLSDGLPQPLEAFRAELYNPDDEPQLARFQTVVQQITRICLQMLRRRTSAGELNVCLARANELVKQSARAACTDRLKVVLQQQAVRLHDLRVAVVSPDVILTAVRLEDPKRLRSLYKTQKAAARVQKRKGSPGTRTSPQTSRAPNNADDASTNPPASSSFAEFLIATLREFVEYSMLTTLMVAAWEPHVSGVEKESRSSSEMPAC